MFYLSVKWRLPAGAMLAAVVGCSGGGGGSPAMTTPTPPATQQSTDFSSLVYMIYGQPANSQPVSLDNLTIVYDVNDDPTDFNGLLM